MAWRILWSDKSQRQLKKIDKKTAKGIIDGVDDIKENPYAAVSRLTGSQFFKLRIGDYRVISDLRYDMLVVFVVETGNRKRIYT